MTCLELADVVHDVPRLSPLPGQMDCAREAAVSLAARARVGTRESVTRRLRRALRSPRYLVRRAIDSARRRARRPWSYLYPRLLTDRALLASLGARDIDRLWADLAAQPFFISSAERANVGERFLADYPGGRAAITQAADAVLRHQFDLLGSGPQQLDTPLPWHTDFKTGRRWPLAYSADIEYNELDRPTDVKVPWELSRCQHFTLLGQAYWLTGDERYAAEFVAETTDWIAANTVAWRHRAMTSRARRELDLGLLFFRRIGRVSRRGIPEPLPSRPVHPRRVHRQASREGRSQRQPLPV